MNEDFVLDDAIRSLATIPTVLAALLRGIPESWLHATEGPGTWSPLVVVGHLIDGEKTGWIPRVRHFLERDPDVPFDDFDREAQLDEDAAGLDELLEEFAALRARNVDALVALDLTEADLDRRGTHPKLGSVLLRQHLATWVCHDYAHLGQIARVLAKRHGEAVGPWARFLSILER